MRVWYSELRAAFARGGRGRALPGGSHRADGWSDALPPAAPLAENGENEDRVSDCLEPEGGARHGMSPVLGRESLRRDILSNSHSFAWLTESKKEADWKSAALAPQYIDRKVKKKSVRLELSRMRSRSVVRN